MFKGRHAIGLAAALAALPAWGQVDVKAPFVRVRTPGPAGVARIAPLRLQGQLVRIGADNTAVIRTADGRDVVVYYGADSRYRLGEKEVLFSSVPAGTALDIQYQLDNNRYVYYYPAAAPALSTLQGRIATSNTNPAMLVLITSSGKQYPLTFDERSPTTVRVEVQGTSNIVRDLAAPSTGVARGDALIQGKVVKVDRDFFIVRDAEGRDVILYTDPNTTYKFDNGTGVLADVKEGAEVTAQYAAEGARRVARAVVNGIQQIIP